MTALCLPCRKLYRIVFHNAQCCIFQFCIIHYTAFHYIISFDFYIACCFNTAQYCISYGNVLPFLNSILNIVLYFIVLLCFILHVALHRLIFYFNRYRSWVPFNWYQYIRGKGKKISRFSWDKKECDITNDRENKMKRKL